MHGGRLWIVGGELFFGGGWGGFGAELEEEFEFFVDGLDFFIGELEVLLGPAEAVVGLRIVVVVLFRVLADFMDGGGVEAGATCGDLARQWRPLGAPDVYEFLDGVHVGKC